MIEKERLEELIKQGAKVWCICDYTYDESKPNKKIEYYDLSNEDICISPAEFRDYGLRVFDALGYWNDIRFECLFETIEEAEWHKEFGCIERTQRLVLPTWEEVSRDLQNVPVGTYIVRAFDDYILFVLFRMSGKKEIYIRSTIGEEFWEFTKENYTLACRKCVELFKGEKK